MKIGAFLTCVVLAMIVPATSLAGAESQLGQVNNRGQLPVLGHVTLLKPTRAIRVYGLGQMVSGANQDLISFLRDAGKPMADWSAKTGFEACSQICKSGKGEWALSVTTNQSHLVCVVVNSCPDGFLALDEKETIHTHPKSKDGFYIVNFVDKKFILVERELGKRVPLGDAEEFSEEDTSSVPGYLITGEGKLRFWSSQTGVVDHGVVGSGNPDKTAMAGPSKNQ